MVGDRPAVRVLVVAADLVRGAGLASLLRRAGGIDVIGETCEESAALRQASDDRPDVVVLDGPSWWAGRACAAVSAHGPVLLVGDRAPRPHAAGHLVAGEFSVAELAGSVRRIAAGRRSAPPKIPTTTRFGLSRREGEVMEHVLRGVDNGEIAQRLFISEKTVKNHVNHIFRKLRARTRAEAIARWLGLAVTS
ncbi:response regulator transcription factor [Couchioplanes caeruleus]|uniref:response regulator transcription factor n=1 Tax=Couchioplanes caeruleus TaxID=56438 RepID=UPI0014758A58|nr:response regulator transcription factor [Couchioplanes caeruleus]